LSIKTEKLTKIYGTQTAIDCLDFEVQKGEVVGFLGPNGAGKSTTMKIITCFTLPTSGTAFIQGYNILEEPIKIRQITGYLPEHNPLYDEMYVREYLLYMANIHRIKKNKQVRVNEMIELTGLTPECHKKIGALSKGYRQRVGLAQVLIHDPEVLLLDEPTSGLDPNQIIEIRNLIKEIGKEKTIMLSSHILQEVQAMCNRIIIINNGKIIADDKTEDLLRKTKGYFALRITLRNPVEKVELMKIKGVEQVDRQGSGWLISSTIDIRDSLFNYAVENNNAIIEMTQEGENLENVFQLLTKSN
jgi:ABC-2 type transport system ATP-binding protein